MSNTSDRGQSTSDRGSGLPPIASLPPSPIRSNSMPLPERPDMSKHKSMRHQVKFSERKFDVKSLPEDLQRVYTKLAEKYGEEYGLTFCFVVRTAVELHRAWHMTLLTSKILQQVKDKFKMRMTWNLGVIHCQFRAEDGGYELHRKVPYDYDSEYQDLYMKIAVALVEGHINVHEALIFQAETKRGQHTAASGLFLREGPGRLVLYPLEAATCAVIFFGGAWVDAGVAAVCGLAAGLVEYSLRFFGSDARVLVDAIIGFTVGVVGGLFYRYTEEEYCLPAIFLGTLYWFFYGTAFVLGLLEIIAGELETGVTRFIAVSVKTFVLTLGSCIGLQVVLVQNVFDTWISQGDQCNKIDLDDEWWRIPLYLLCSVSVLGQYRVPIIYYWRGLMVQLAGYEVQYQMLKYFAERHDQDFLDTAVSNIVGAVASVVAAAILSYMVDNLGYYYSARLLHRDNGKKFSKFGEAMYTIGTGFVRLSNCVGLGRKSSLKFLELNKRFEKSSAELKDPHHPRSEIVLTQEEEVLLVEAIVDAENLNNWSILMPAVYQLVPGSLIARLWYNAVFPPPHETTVRTIVGSDLTYLDSASNTDADDVFYGLFVISTSLALGILIGFAFVNETTRFLMFVTHRCRCFKVKDQTEEEKQLEKERLERLKFRQQGIMPDVVPSDDPDGGDAGLIRKGSNKATIGQDRVGFIRSKEVEAMGDIVEVEDEDAADSSEVLKMDGTEVEELHTPAVVDHLKNVL